MRCRLEMRADNRPDASRNFRPGSARVDDHPTPIGSELPVGPTYRGVEVGAGAFEPIAKAGNPVFRNLIREIEHNHDVGLETAGRNGGPSFDLFDTESPGDALIRQRRR